jgi:diguanylate cyclase (GGDEF)-like protein
VNDTHGHGAGDDLLRTVGGWLVEEVRDGDLVARVGGDEFVVVLPGAKLPDALATAERIRARLSEPMPVEGVAEPLSVSASLGVAVSLPGHTVASLLRDADGALYAAKRRGRDRVEVAAGAVEDAGPPG